MTPVQVAALSVSGSQTALVVSDITVRGDTSAQAAAKTATCKVLRSIVQNGAVGIDALGCNRLVIEQSIVSSRSLGLESAPAPGNTAS